MMDYIEIIFRWAFAVQMVFWGLNGFFNWVTIPPAPPTIESFVKACIESKFIMPTVKIIEIVFGIFLAMGFLIPLSLLIFAPIIFVITGLHVIHNKNYLPILLQFTFPFMALVLFHSEHLLRLVH